MNKDKKTDEPGVEFFFTLGKNFVFAERLGERISEDLLAAWHTCGEPADTHTNCANQACHVLFKPCDACPGKTLGYCSDSCQKIVQLPPEIQKEIIRELIQTNA